IGMPVAIKVRNFSAKFARQVLDTVAGPEIQMRNRARQAKGLAPTQVFEYEHVIQVEDYTNKAGNTFPILAYKKVQKTRDALKGLAGDAHAILMAATPRTVQMEE